MNVKDVHTKAEGTNENRDENGVELKKEMEKTNGNIFGAIENFKVKPSNRIIPSYTPILHPYTSTFSTILFGRVPQNSAE